MTKKISVFLLILFYLSVTFVVWAEDETSIFSMMAHRISARAQIIKERVESIHEESSSKIPNLYCFITGVLEDAHGLYSLGDIDNARYKITILDTISYDIICAGVSASFELNNAVAKLQQSDKAGSLVEFKNITESLIGTVTRRGLLESVHFTVSQERYFTALLYKMKAKLPDIEKLRSENDIRSFFNDTHLIDADNIYFSLPKSIPPPATGFIFGFKIDQNWGLIPLLYFDTPVVAKETLLLGLWSLLAYAEGFGMHHNETLESQLHYILCQMRVVDFLLKNKDEFRIKNSAKLEDVRQSYQADYEGLAEESFMPGYYDELFALKAYASLEHDRFDWAYKPTYNPTPNNPASDDYLFYLTGNGSQMPPNPRLVEFFNNLPHGFPYGSAFDLGSGDGRNSRFLANRKSLFHEVVAIDHSTVAISRLKRLSLLEPDIPVRIRPIEADILNYKYPDEQTPVFQRPNFILLDNVIGYIPYQKRIRLFAECARALLPGGVMFVEYHLAQGKRFSGLDKAENIQLDNDNTIITTYDFQGTQKKHFFKQGEITDQLNKSGIMDGKEYSVTHIYSEHDNDFHTGIAIIRKQP